MTRKLPEIFLQNAMKWCFLALFFFLPLLFYRHASEVFELPKMYFIYAMTVVICAFWIGRMIMQKRLLIQKTPLDIPILLFLISQMISTFLSIDPHTSWFGYYGRFHGGLLSTICYTLLYYAFVCNIDSKIRNPNIEIRNKSQISNEKKTKRFVSDIGILNFEFVSNFGFRVSSFLTTILFSATIVAVYAILQHFGVDKNYWVQDVVNRVFSTQGQPNWLAAYLVMVMPLTWISMIKKQKAKTCALCFLFFVFLTTLLYTRSRSGLIGFAVMDVVFWLAMFAKKGLKDKGQRLREFTFIHAIAILTICSTSNPIRDFLFQQFQQSPASSLSPHPLALGPLLDSSITLRKSAQGGTESGDIRRVVWSGALELVKRYPLFGTGPETFAYTYWWVRPIEHNLTSEWNFLYNKAHNEWLNLAANTGLFGLGSHILLLVWFTIWSAGQLKIRNPNIEIRNKSQISNDKNSKKSVSNIGILNFEFVSSFEFRDSNLIIAAFLAAILGVEAVNFLGFSTVTVGAYSYLYMAMAVKVGTRDKGQGTREKQAISNSAISSSLSPHPLALSLILLIAVALSLLFHISLLFLADLSYAHGRALLAEKYAFEALRPLELAVQFASDEPTFRASLAEDEGLLAVSLHAMGSEPDMAEKLKNESLSNFDIVGKEHPYSLAFLKTQSRITYSLGVFDPALYERGIDLSKKAFVLAPTNPSLPYAIGVMQENLGNNEDAARSYQTALDLKPDYQEAKEKLKKLDAKNIL